MTGYIHPGYAQSLSEFGSPYHLPECGGWLLKRRISDLADHDAMGCYPMFCCRDWSKLHLDLDGIGKEFVSLAMVTDPFGDYEEVYLRQCFKDKVMPFKEHFIVDLCRPMDKFLSSHHRRNIRKALSVVEVEICPEPLNYLEDWMGLYDNLTQRYHIKGIQKFSDFSFTEQFKNPGITLFRACRNETTVGLILWYQQNDVGYYHLGAYSSLGYDLKASFALFWYAIKHFMNAGLRYLSLGAGAGVRAHDQGGLSRFKEGWSTGTRTAYFCGRIFDQDRYSEITRSKGLWANDYFPAYRKGEFD